jgi:hypothetical protein
LGEALYLKIVNSAYAVPPEKLLIAGKLPPGPGANERTVVRVEQAMNLLPEVVQFDHFGPSAWLIKNLGVLDTKDYPEAFDRFETLFKALNSALA